MVSESDGCNTDNVHRSSRNSAEKIPMTCESAFDMVEQLMILIWKEAACFRVVDSLMFFKKW